MDTPTAPTQPRCPRCGSPRWVSVSLDRGWTRRAQCVPCGAHHPDVIGPGWKSPRFHDDEAAHPAYRVREAELPADVTAIVISPVQPDEMLPGETTAAAMARLRRAVVIRE